MSSHGEKKYLTTAKAAQYLGVSTATIYRMIAKGLLTPMKTPGGQRRFTTDELDVYLQTSKEIVAPQNPSGVVSDDNLSEPTQLSIFPSDDKIDGNHRQRPENAQVKRAQGEIRIERCWAMPCKNTFEIKPIAQLLNEELTDGLWIDPFANRNKLASITNDLNMEYDTDFHLDALDFLKMFEDASVDGVLYDPPYSPRQVAECYNDVGYNVTWDTTKASFWGNHKREISRIVKVGGKVITFGWNSGGIGYKYGFEIIRILLVPHGGWHNDTICTVEIKTHEGVEDASEHATLITTGLKKEFSESPIDSALINKLVSLPSNFWDFSDADTSEYTHGLHYYPAMMVFPISRNIIKIMKDLMPISSLFDPFSGSGTVLVEGMLAGIENVVGNDINPLALLLNKVKTTLIGTVQLNNAVEHLLALIDKTYHDNMSFYDEADDFMRTSLSLDLTATDGWGKDAPTYLLEYCKQNGIVMDIPFFKNIGYWFKPRVILLLQMIKDQISKVQDVDIHDFVLVAFSETIRLVSNRRNGEFKMFRMPLQKVEEFAPDVILQFKKILLRNVKKMEEFSNECSRNHTQSKVSLYHNNACSLQDVPGNTFDLIITSPPYGDSRTTVAYGEFSRLSLQWIGMYGLSDQEIMGLDRMLMGGKKYRNGFDYLLPSETLRRSLERIKDVDIERAGDVFSFYHDLAESVEEITKKTKRGGYQFWVVANRTVKSVLLKTDIILAELGKAYGLEYVYTIDRHISNKVMPSVNSPTNEVGKTAMTMNEEHIVILRKR